MERFYALPMSLRIRQLREGRGWTQADLAERSGMSRSQLAMIEAETRPANTLRLNAIAAALGVKPEQLFEIEAGEQRLMDLVRDLSEGDRALIRSVASSSRIHTLRSLIVLSHGALAPRS